MKKSRILVIGVMALFLAACTSPLPSRNAESRSPSTAATTSTTVSTTTAPAPTTTTTAALATASVACSSGSSNTSYNQPSGSETATEGEATSVVSWSSRSGPAPYDPYVRGATVLLKGAGQVLLDRALSSPTPQNDSPSMQSSFADGWENLEQVCVETPGSGLPIVYVNGYADAMTCCDVQRVYYPLSNGTYAYVDRDLGRAPETVEKLGNLVVVATANRDFFGRFDCEACSAAPVQLFNFRAGNYVDVTREFPTEISADAQLWWNGYESHPDDPLGGLPAWTADECELGRQSSAFSTLDSMASEGKLTPSPGSPPTTYAFGPTGSSYVTSLKSFLEQEGYCS